jgi:hypothetical protein
MRLLFTADAEIQKIKAKYKSNTNSKYKDKDVGNSG